MPRKKKKPAKQPVPEKILSMSGWSVGDIAWVVMSGDTRPSQLEIFNFHPNDKTLPSLTGRCIATGKSRTVGIEWCEDTRPKAKKNFEKRRKK